MAEEPRRRFHLPKVPRQVRWTVTIVVLIFLADYVVLPDIANVRKSLNLLGRVNIAYIVLAVGLEAAALLSYAELSRAVLNPSAPKRWRMFRINMASLSVSHVLPGGTAPGTAIGYRLLVESGVPPATAGFGLATQGIGSAVVLNAIFWVALIISIPFNGFNPEYLIAAALGAVLLGAFAGIIFLLTKGGCAGSPTTSPSSPPSRSRACSKRWPTASRSCCATASCSSARSAGRPPTGSWTRRRSASSCSRSGTASTRSTCSSPTAWPTSWP
jgi:hypothetical protein